MSGVKNGGFWHEGEGKSICLGGITKSSAKMGRYRGRMQVGASDVWGDEDMGGVRGINDFYVCGKRGHKVSTGNETKEN